MICQSSSGAPLDQWPRVVAGSGCHDEGYFRHSETIINTIDNVCEFFLPRESCCWCAETSSGDKVLSVCDTVSHTIPASECSNWFKKIPSWS